MIVLCVSLIVPVVLSADDLIDRETAQQTAESYIAAFMDGRTHEAYLLLAGTEREGVTLAQYESYLQATFPTADRVEPVRESYPALYEFVLENLYVVTTNFIEETDNKLVVHIDLSTIDLLTIAFEIATKYPEAESDELTDAQIDELYKKALAELYVETEPPRTSIVVPIGVSIEDGTCVVYPGIRQSFDRMRAGELSGLAWDAKFDGRTEYAAQLYEEAIELDPDNDAYQQELVALNFRLDEMNRQLALEKSAYVTRHISIETSKPDLSGFPVIVCSIRNGGEKAIEKIEFRITYLDESELLMDVEIGVHDFWGEPLRPGEVRRDVRIDTYEAPFDWTGNRYRLEFINENP